MVRDEHDFSLVELMAIMVIMGLLASMITISVHGRNHRLNTQEMISHFNQVETLAREHALSHRAAAQMLIDPVRNEYTVFDNNPENMGGQISGILDVMKVRVGNSRETFSQVSIPISSRGQTPTYALAIGNTQEKVLWILVIGLSGEIVQTFDESLVEAAFSGSNNM